MLDFREGGKSKEKYLHTQKGQTIFPPFRHRQETRSLVGNQWCKVLVDSLSFCGSMEPEIFLVNSQLAAENWWLENDTFGWRRFIFMGELLVFREGNYFRNKDGNDGGWVALHKFALDMVVCPPLMSHDQKMLLCDWWLVMTLFFLAHGKENAYLRHRLKKSVFFLKGM